MLSKSIFLGIVGFLVSFYAGFNDNLVLFVFGLLMVFLQIVATISSLEEDVNLLKDRINVHLELQKLWTAIKEVKK